MMDSSAPMEVARFHQRPASMGTISALTMKAMAWE